MGQWDPKSRILYFWTAGPEVQIPPPLRFQAVGPEVLLLHFWTPGPKVLISLLPLPGCRS